MNINVKQKRKRSQNSLKYEAADGTAVISKFAG